MPELDENIEYDPNAGELFPFHSEQNNNTRARAMYFFHNSRGEDGGQQSLKFVNQVQVGGDSSGSGWNGPAGDIESWPILDSNSETIEVYSDGSTRCYQYRIRNGNIRWHINHPPGWDFNLGNVESQAGVSETDAAIYKRYVDALEFNLDGDTTKSIRLSFQDDESENLFRECLVDIELTYTDPNGIVRTCDGSYDQTTNGVNSSNGNVTNGAGYFCSPTPLVDGFGTDENWLQKIGGAMDAANGGNSINEDGVWTWGGSAQWMTTSSSSNSNGIIFFNRVGLDGGGGGGSVETQTGQFIVGGTISDYQEGDFLYLEAEDEDNFFHQRLVRVVRAFSTTNNEEAVEIETQDSEGFEDESTEELFTVTKLTHAPKLKIEYTIPNSSSEGITILDDVEDVN